jgi:hypothetical protein
MQQHHMMYPINQTKACEILQGFADAGYSMSSILGAAMSWDSLRHPRQYSCLYGGKFRQKMRALAKSLGTDDREKRVH